MLAEIEHAETAHAGVLNLVEHDDQTGTPAGRPHPLCAMIRQLRNAQRLSLAQFEERFGYAAVVVGAYERGDRIPPLPKLDAILGCFGYRLTAEPIGEHAIRTPGDIVAELRHIADQLERSAQPAQPQNQC